MPPDITAPEVDGSANKMLVWILGLVAAGIVAFASWTFSRMNADSDFTRKLVENGTTERAEHLKALTVLGENVRNAGDQTKALVQSSEQTNRWLEKIAGDQAKFPAVRNFAKEEGP